MRRFEAVIQSEDSPGTGSLWLKDKKLWFFEGGWKPIQGASDVEENKNPTEVEKLLVGNRSLTGDNKVDTTSILEQFAGYVNYQAPVPSPMGTPTANVEDGLVGVMASIQGREYPFPSLYNKITFQLEPSAKAFNCKVLTYIEENVSSRDGRCIPVYVKDYRANCIPAVFNLKNALIYALLDGDLVVYKVDTTLSATRGNITKINTVQLAALPTCISLELGNTDEIKARNKEKLYGSFPQFLVTITGAGIGVGSYRLSSGGEATIQTASGNRVHYIINKDGELRQIERFEQFYNLGQIDVETLPRTITLRDEVDLLSLVGAISPAIDVSGVGRVGMNLVSTSAVTGERVYTSPNIICKADQGWNYVRATATLFNDRIEIYLETV